MIDEEVADAAREHSSNSENKLNSRPEEEGEGEEEYRNEVMEAREAQELWRARSDDSDDEVMFEESGNIVRMHGYDEEEGEGDSDDAMADPEEEGRYGEED